MVTPGISESLNDEWEGIPWLLRIYGYEIQDSVIEEMHQLFHPVILDCGDVQIEIREILYDGAWMYTSAVAIPTHPEDTILLPNSAAFDDCIAGGYFEDNRKDKRSFFEAANEDRKDLLYVEAYPIEYNESAYRFSDHRQDADPESTLFSGAPLVLNEDINEIHFLVQSYRISIPTGEETAHFSAVYPVAISRLNSKRRIYWADSDKIPFNRMTLLQTPLATHVFPDWIDIELEMSCDYTLLDMNGVQYNKGIPEDLSTYQMTDLPSLIIVQFKTENSQVNEMVFEALNE